MKVLGVTDHRFLGGPGRWRDSGMMGTPANDRPDCFWQADFEDATRELVRVIREVRPHVVITYDENGGYGHPDATSEQRKRFPLLATYELALKCSHLFNLLDARGAISVTERVGVIGRIRALAVGVAKAYAQQQG